VHAIAHIEFNAINLALDAACRFRDMPGEYYLDWVCVAADEARHFSLLQGRLVELGASYGDFPAHNGLWEMAELTADSCLARMALVPRVLEARGLDVTPGMIERLRLAGDLTTIAALEVILREEVGHVATGTRWFTLRTGKERPAAHVPAPAESAIPNRGGPLTRSVCCRIQPAEMAAGSVLLWVNSHQVISASGSCCRPCASTRNWLMSFPPPSRTSLPAPGLVPPPASACCTAAVVCPADHPWTVVRKRLFHRGR
jgi:hypothetical protein